MHDILNTTVMEREFNKSFTTAALDSKFRGLRVYIIVLIKIKQNKVPPLIIFTTTRHNKYPGLEWWRALADNQYHSLLIIEQRDPFFQEFLFSCAPDMFTYDFISSISLQQFGKCNENTVDSYTWHSIQQQNYQPFVIKSRIK